MTAQFDQIHERYALNGVHLIDWMESILTPSILISNFIISLNLGKSWSKVGFGVVPYFTFVHRSNFLGLKKYGR